MSKEFIQCLKDIVEDENSIRLNYSGRCMFGKSCVGVVTDDAFLLIADMFDYARKELEDGNGNLFDEVFEAVYNTSTDSMGLSTILYWQHIQHEE